MGIFKQAGNASGLFSYYFWEAQFRDKVVGGTPKNPDMIEGWLRRLAGLTDREEEIKALTYRTLVDLGMEVQADMSIEDMISASKQVAASLQTVGFKRDAKGLYLESRILKAAIRENVNILYAGDRWGKTSKGPKSFTAERVFPMEDRLHLGRQEPDDVLPFTGHITGPQGPRSTLTYYEFCERATISATIMVLRDEFEFVHWTEVWNQTEENGLGAMRSQGFGRFDVLRFDKFVSEVPFGAEELAAARNGELRPTDRLASPDELIAPSAARLKVREAAKAKKAAKEEAPDPLVIQQAEAIAASHTP